MSSRPRAETAVRLAVLVACALYLLQGVYYARTVVPVHDAVMYLVVGAKAVRGEVSTFDDRIVGHRPPLPFYVLGLTQLGGPSLAAARYANVALGLAALLMAAMLAHRLGGALAGGLAAFFLATQGVVIAYYAYEGYPAVAAACFTLAVLLVFGARGAGGRVAGMAATGVLFFVRTNVWPAIPVLLAYGLARARTARERLGALAVVVGPPLLFFAWDSRHLKLLANVPVLRRLVAPLGYVGPLVMEERETLPLPAQVFELARVVRRYEFWVLALLVLAAVTLAQRGWRPTLARLRARPPLAALLAFVAYMLLVQFAVFSWNWKWVGLYLLPFAPLVPVLLGVGFAAAWRAAGTRVSRAALAGALGVLLLPPLWIVRNPILPAGETLARDPLGAAHRAAAHLRRLVPGDARIFFYGLNPVYYLSGLPVTHLQQIYLWDQFPRLEVDDWIVRRSGFVPRSDMRRWLGAEDGWAVVEQSVLPLRLDGPGPEREMQALIDRDFELVGTVDELWYMPYRVYRRKQAERIDISSKTP